MQVKVATDKKSENGNENRNANLSAARAMGTQPEGKTNDREEYCGKAEESVSCISIGDR